MIIYGTAHRGWVDGVSGQALATRFVHVYGLPIVPLRSVWVTDRAMMIGHACRWSWRSVVAAYGRAWGPTLVVFGLATRSVGGLVAAGLAAALAAWSLRWRTLRSPRARWRAVLQQAALASACDPARLPRAVAAEVSAAAAASFAAVSDGRTALDVARRGARTPLEAAHAFVVLRLVAATARGGVARAAWVASERLLERVGPRDARGADAGPYREAGAVTPLGVAPVAIAQGALRPATVSWLAGTLALLAAIPLLLIWPRAWVCGCGESRGAIAHSMARKLVSEAYPDWVASHPGRCPTLDDLGEYANNNVKDPWGHPYRLRCDERSLAVWSVGPNGRDEGGDGDDLASWKD